MTIVSKTPTADRLKILDLELEIFRVGRGRPLLLIHGIHPVSPKSAFVERLAESFEVIAPTAPGFGATARPADFDTPYDLVHLYSEVLAGLSGEEVAVLGLSFGGWIAAELAATVPAKLGRLVLADPLGIKVSAPDKRDIAHLFTSHPADLERRAWFDPSRRPADSPALGWQEHVDTIPDEGLLAVARNWDALCAYSWRPHMYNPQLKRWLGRIKVPTLVVWGSADRIVTPDYGRNYAGLIPGARFTLIDQAGHHPELEQPEAFVRAVSPFLQGKS